MIDPTVELSVERTDLGLAPLVANDDQIVEMNEPVLLDRTEYARSRNLEGSVALRSTYENANINAVIRLEADTAAALRVLRDEWRAAVSQFSVNVTQTVNGIAETYRTEGRGRMSQANGSYSYENLRRFVEHYQVTFTVYPLPIGA